MPQDAYTLRYLCGELNSIFTGGRINRIVQPSADELIFTVYSHGKTRRLLIDVNPASPRIGVTEKDRESPLTAPNFCMLLRKHLLASEIKGLSLIGFDRIVKIDMEPSSEFFDERTKTLYVELMGRYSNVILTEQGKVLGGNRGINFFDNGVRPLIVGREYRFPPVGDKKIPSDTELIEVFEKTVTENNAAALAAAICGHVQGIAASTAKEIAGGYFEEHKDFCAREFFEHLNAFVYKKDYRPCVISERGAVKDVCVYPYKYISGDVLSFSELSEAEDYYFTERGRIKRFSALKERLSAAVNSALKKAARRLSAVTAREKDAEDAELNRLKGELILANIYKLKGGEKQFTADNYYDGGTINIALDERLSAADNAQKYYKKYNKQKRALAALAPQREAAEKDADYLKSVADFIAMAEKYQDLAEIKEELVSAGLLNERNPAPRKHEKRSEGRVYSVSGYTVRAGRNNTENDKIAFGARGEDVWLHAKNYHSSHVIIEVRGGFPPEEVLLTAAEICAYYSAGREGGKTEIVYTRRKNVKKPKGAKPGFVTYSDFKSVMAVPKKHEELLKAESGAE